MEAQELQLARPALYRKAVALLERLIATPSYSREEQHTADLIYGFMKEEGVDVNRHLNNVWAKNRHFDPSRPTLLINSHHDTVKPNKEYTLDPFGAIVKDGRLYGLGSNDAGASVVSMLACFLSFYERADMNYNLIYAASAEEEISGSNGIESLLPLLGKVDCGIVGEPTGMDMAVAEKGLLVLDCVSHGKAGHAARNDGENAIYKAMKDIAWFSSYEFPKASPLLGPVKMSVTCIDTLNKAHNVIPSSCNFVVDIRVNELYAFDDILNEIKKHVSCDIRPRSTRLRSTSISENHPLVRSGIALGRSMYGSPTTSDKALMHFPTLKMGPGNSNRSHTADEFIYLSEINDAIDIYTQLLNNIL